MSRPEALPDDTCTEHTRPASHELERFTLDDLRTVQAVMEQLAADHRGKVQRLERAQVMTDQARAIALDYHREAATRYARISVRVVREILELDGEL